MKILHVYKDFSPPIDGGMEQHMALSCRFQREWAEVKAMTCSRSFITQVVERDGIQVNEVGEWGRFQGAPLSPKFPLHLKMAQADVIVVHVPNPTAELSWLLMRPRAKLIVRYQSDVVRQARAMKYYRPYQQAFLNKADAILVSSQQYLDTSTTLAPFQDKCRIVPLGIVADDFANPDPERVEEFHEHYGERYILFAGRHRYYKGLPTLIKAAQDLDVTVVIAGDGPERKKLIHYAKELGVDVVFPGHLSHADLKAHLHGATAVAFPSILRSEAYGIGILEAHACATPVVATTLGTGVERVNLHEVTGLNVPPGDSQALAAALNTLLDDPALCDQYGAQAKARVIQEFDAQAIAQSEFAIYQDVLDAH